MKRTRLDRWLKVCLLGVAFAGCRHVKPPADVVHNNPPRARPGVTASVAIAVTEQHAAYNTGVVSPGSGNSNIPMAGDDVIVVESSGPAKADGKVPETTVIQTGGTEQVHGSPAAGSPDAQAVVQEAQPAPNLPTPSARRSYVDMTAQPCFAHAPDYSWLCGQLQHFGHNWRLRYASVDEDDANGGSVTLVEDGQLQICKDGQYVRIEGQMTQGGSKRIAPTYQISSLKVLDKPDAVPDHP